MKSLFPELVMGNFWIHTNLLDTQFNQGAQFKFDVYKFGNIDISHGQNFDLSTVEVKVDKSMSNSFTIITFNLTTWN